MTVLHCKPVGHLERRRAARRGLTLLEIIVSMAIFLIALGAIVPLIQIGQQRAMDVEMQAFALQKCQSKIAEVISGGEMLTNQNDAPFSDNSPEEDWRWSMDASQDELNKLWTVTVRVFRQMEGVKVEVALTQKVLDPTVRGGPPPAPVVTTDTTGTTTGSTTTGGG